MESGTAFYCVADERYFLGAVGLVNSLRLVGHREPIHLLDCGLTTEQRELLAGEVELGDGDTDTPPWLLKTVLPLERPVATMVLLDADIVAVRSLAPLAERAAAGELVAFENPVARWVPEWGELLALGPLQRGRYLGSGAIAAPATVAKEVLELMADRQGAVDFEQTHWRANVEGYAFEFADQDVFNAILARAAAPDPVALPHRLAPTPPFEGLRLMDEHTLRCGYDDGTEPFLVHHHTAKPWLEPTHDGVYSRLLRRLLVGDDVAVRVPEAMVPVRLRHGARAWAARARINARERFRYHVREPLAARRQGIGR